MASVQWDKLLETCCRRKGTDLLLLPGSPPMIRVNDLWRALAIPLLTSRDITVLAAEQLEPKPDGDANGYAYRDFWYGREARFRVFAFGFPEVTTMLVSRYQSPNAPPAASKLW